MKLNYFWIPPDGDAVEESVHVGKVSAGWAFQLHLHTDKGIDSLEAWMERWSQENCTICDEYGQRLSAEDLTLLVENGHPKKLDMAVVPSGFDSWKDFFHKNDAVIDPVRWTLRSLPSEGRPIRWGATWDEVPDLDFR